MKKILVVYATAGIGHKKASLAVRDALKEIAPEDTEIKTVDVLDYTDDFFKIAYLKFYLIMVNRLPLLWGLLYYLSDNRFFDMLTSGVRKFGDMMNAKKFAEFLATWKPDVVVSTHFLASEIVSESKKRKMTDTRLITVVTDYKLHSWWVAGLTDTYVVGSDDAKRDLLRWGVDPLRIKVLGIPAQPIFSKKLDEKSISERIGFKQGVFTILVIGGGFGVGPIESIIRIIGGISKPVQIIAVCGHNSELVKKLESLKSSIKGQLHILGFVDNVYEYMEISDILISKSGGITVAESLSKGLPMIIISPIMGQETRNSEFLTGHNAAIRLSDLSELAGVLEDLITNPEKIKKLRDAIDTIKKPSACYDVAHLAIEMTGK